MGTSFIDQRPYDPASREVASDTRPIILAFKRAPEAEADVDYICGFGTIGDNHPNFGIPGRGLLSMEGGVILMDGDYAPYAHCSIFRADEGGGGVEEEYKHDYTGKTIFSESGGGLYYDVVTGWGERYREPGNWTKVLFDYQLDITACFQMETRVKRVTWRVSSREKSGRNIWSIPKLQIMWGCLAKGTLIDRPDQPPCPIEDIHINDIVSGRNGTPMRVTNVWRGEEENLVSLVTKQGSRLRLTENHPVLTPEGWRHAADLTPGMAVLDRNGQAAELQEVSLIPYEGEICNLDLVPIFGEDRLEDHVMVAGGLCVGDNRGQNELDCGLEGARHG